MENMRIVERYPGKFHIQDQVERIQTGYNFKGIWPFRRLVEGRVIKKVWVTRPSEFGDLTSAKKYAKEQIFIRENYPKYYNL